MPTTQLYRKYLDPEVVSRLANMDLRARLVVEGFLTGLHRSPYHGFSVEFAEHRQYMPGDEIRHVDWKVYGKTDRFYVKQFEEETNLKSYLLLDQSTTMRFSTQAVNKFQYASFLAAALSFLMIRQRDAVGLLLFAERHQQYIPPRALPGQLTRILKLLEMSSPLERTPTGIGAALHNIAERLKRRGLIILLSDLQPNDPETDLPAIISGLRHLRHQKHEVLVFQILDPAEIDFPYSSEAIFEDMETGERLPVQPNFLRRAYREAARAYYDALQRASRENHIDFVPLNTTAPFDQALLQYLLKRQRLGG
jgi:uncharacterized protein (DUF58 family)